jgi:glycine betaine catabolism A
MGDTRGPDVGTLRLRTLPNFWCHESSDHAVLTRLLPAAPGETEIQLTWLVDENAAPGRDYELDTLLPFWRLTSEQDWALCEANHRGSVTRLLWRASTTASARRTSSRSPTGTCGGCAAPQLAC